MIYIYTLSDPKTSEIRYVGKTTNPKQRRHNHSNKARDQGTHKRNWIESLRRQGLKPIFEIIDVVIDNWQFWEQYWIQQCKAWGFKLTNHTIGGDGLSIGNNTTFKKGQIPWNKGTANTKICVICNNEFNRPPSNKQRTCSVKCSLKIKKSSATTFQPNHNAWNKGKSGYSTAKKGRKITDLVLLNKLRSNAIGNTNRRKKVYQYTINNILINTYDSITDAKEITKISSIGNCVTGRSKTAGGYIWLLSPLEAK